MVDKESVQILHAYTRLDGRRSKHIDGSYSPDSNNSKFCILGTVPTDEPCEARHGVIKLLETALSK